jgi:KaiC/GvpD/RAD55 family RecA-like ATPase
MVKLETGTKGLDKLIGGEIESGSKNILHGSLDCGKTVFARQLLWQWQQNGETARTKALKL